MEGIENMAKYYLMKNRLILRLEDEHKMETQPKWIQQEQLDTNWISLNQEQANYRVVIFRDEILELDEYIERRKRKQSKLSPESNA